MFSVSFQGPTYYNSIENDIKESHSLAPIIQNEIEKIYIYMNYYKLYISSHVWYYFYTYFYLYHTLYFVNSVYVIS